MVFLKGLFWEEDVHHIVSIPICALREPDRWIWHYSKNGVFSICSAYKLLSEGLFLVESFQVGGYSNWWHKLWSLQIPSKIKLFMWRMFCEFIPTNLSLHKKHIPIHPWCNLCKKKEESCFHTFFKCCRVKQFWKMKFP